MPRTIRDHSGGRECWSDLALLETGRTYSARGARLRAGRIRGADCCDAVARIDYIRLLLFAESEVAHNAYRGHIRQPVRIRMFNLDLFLDSGDQRRQMVLMGTIFWFVLSPMPPPKTILMFTQVENVCSYVQN